MFNINTKEAEQAGYVRNRHYRGGTSFPEQFIFRSLLQIFSRAENRVIDSELELEFDIFIPEIDLRIEYSGSYWHADEEKRIRDQKRRNFCERSNVPYIEIIEDNKNNKIEVQKEKKHIVYNIGTSGNYSIKASTLIKVIEHILYQIGVVDINIDYTRAMYEALMLSTPYQYNILRDEEANIIGKKYTEQVYYDYHMNNEYINEIIDCENKFPKIKPVTREENKLIDYDYNIINELIFNGNSLEKIGIKPKEDDIEVKRRKLNDFELMLGKREIEINIKNAELKKKIEEIEQAKELVEMTNEQIIQDRKQNKILSKKLKENNKKVSEELNKLAYIERCIKERDLNFDKELKQVESECEEKLQKMREEVNKKNEGLIKMRKMLEYYKRELCKYKFSDMLKD